jgi:restriction endonuclease S subunit
VFLVSCGALESRIDPNFYRLDFQEIKDKITKNNFKKLGYLVDFSSETWNGKDFFDDTFPYIEISEIDIFSGNIQNISNVPKNEAPSRAKMIVKNNDILVSTTRPNRGAISFVKLQENEIQIASTGFAILRNIKAQIISKDFLFFCLRQEFSLKQMEQRSSGGNYPAITTEELKNVLIPIPPLSTQTQIVQLFDQAYESKKAKETEAKRLLAGIDAYLLEKLGIISPEKTENKKSFFVKFSQVQGKRFDPFYHKTEFEELEKAITTSKFEKVKLRDILTFLESGSRPSGGVSQYESGILSFGGEHINDKCEVEIRNEKYIPLEYHKNHLQTSTKMFDILLVKDGATTGKIGIITEQNHTEQNINEHVFMMRFGVSINCFYILNLLATSFYQKQIGRIITGATVTGLTKDVVRNLQIPLPPLSIQTEIAEHIQGVRAEAKRLENEAKDEVMKAKKEVEMLILN